MRKFLPPLIVGGVLIFGTVLLNTRVPAGPVRVYEDPIVEVTNACYRKYERVLHAPTEAEKGDLFWWCARHSVKP